MAFNPASAAKRWVFIPVEEFPNEAKDGLAGWRALIEKSRKGNGGLYEFQLKFKSGDKMTSAGWFKQVLCLVPREPRLVALRLARMRPRLACETRVLSCVLLARSQEFVSKLTFLSD